MARSEFWITTVLIILLIGLINPFGLLMPGRFEMLLITTFVIVFAVFAVLVWRERPRDEREASHRLVAGRYAFLLGAVVLVLGIFFESLSHTLDPWLPIALGAMIFGKVLGLLKSSQDN